MKGYGSCEFSFTSLGENMMSNFSHDYTTNGETNFPLMFAIIFSGVTGEAALHFFPRFTCPESVGKNIMKTKQKNFRPDGGR